MRRRIRVSRAFAAALKVNAELAAKLQEPPRNKYGAKRTTVDDVTFDSQREARCYRDLRHRAKAGEIDNLELQPEFPLWVVTADGERIAVGIYRADFRYRDRATGTWPVVDAKGIRTPVYRLKKRMVEALYGFRIVEV